MENNNHYSPRSIPQNMTLQELTDRANAVMSVEQRRKVEDAIRSLNEQRAVRYEDLYRPMDI